MARVKDVLDDEEWKVRPLSLLLASCAAILGIMIIVNALSHSKFQRVAVSGAPTPGSIQQPGSAGPDGSQTIVLKYDPLIEDTQRELLALGMYKGIIDGVNGLRTKQAIIAYQQANGLTPNGDASADLVEHMRFTRKVQQAAQFTGSVTAATTPAAPTSAPLAPASLAAAPAQEVTVKKVQVALAGLGYDISKLDGEVNAETRSAILKYEMDNGLDMGGTVDDALLQALKVH